jgi:hypothetical protein
MQGYAATIDYGEDSNTRHNDPRMACTTSTDQTWAGMLETANNTLHLNGLKRVPV